MNMVKNGLRGLRNTQTALAARTRLALGRPVRFAGAYPSRDAALASLPQSDRGAYDQDDVADVSYEAMTQIAPWDYPVMFWMSRFLDGTETLSLLDAGGHFGTKFTAFTSLLPADRLDWHVWDLPAILRAARAGQATGKIPAAIRFEDTPAAAGQVDLLLASGLMQYIDVPLASLIGDMAALPKWVILNKVAVRSGPSLVTLEQIGPARVPYQIRNETAWEEELNALGYTLLDRWNIPSLSHRISTHPALGESRSLGYVLERTGKQA